MLMEFILCNNVFYDEPKGKIRPRARRYILGVLERVMSEISEDTSFTFLFARGGAFGPLAKPH